MTLDSKNYELGSLENVDFTALEKSFDNLPPDPYAEHRLRSRRYSRFFYKDGQLNRLTHAQFMQSSQINKAVGDIHREFEEIEDNILENPAFLKLFDEFTQRADLSEDDPIEAHQIRWHCRRNIKLPAPEGMHQDGFDYIAMFMISSENVDGGEVLVYADKDSAPVFKKMLTDGEFVVLNDRAMFHNAAPLVPTANDDDGHWDLIVLTANKSN